MPWKFILFIFFLILGAVFTGLNLGNSCNINFGFKTFEQIPVFLTILFAFLAGIVVTLPFTLGRGKKEGSPKAPKAEKQGKPRRPLFAKKEKIAKNASVKMSEENTVLPAQNVFPAQNPDSAGTKKA